MTTERWYVLPLNPEGWAVGPLAVARTGGKLRPFMGRNQQLHAYKEAVAEELVKRYGSLLPTDSEVELKVYAWQRLDSYTSHTGRKTRDKAADLTNIVKATEDAIQKILIKNDNKVMAQRNVIADRSPAIEGALVISINDWQGLNPNELPQHVWDQLDLLKAEQDLTVNQQLEIPDGLF